jgi:monoamine oxidase
LKLLGVGTVGVAGSAAIGCSPTPSAETKKVDVVVVGAGFAGMVAARELVRKGKSVVVLEARDRVGGRVKAGTIAGQTVDVGGMWVGPTQTKLLALIKEFGLNTTPQFVTGKNVEEIAGKKWLAEGEQQDLEPAAQKEFDTVFSELDRLSAQVQLDSPWVSPQAEEFDRITVADWLNANMKHESARSMMHAVVRALYEAEDYQMSFLYFLFYIRSGDSMETLLGVKDAAQAFRIVEGMYGVAERLAGELGKAIAFKTPVRAIVQDSTGVTVRSDQGTWRAERAVVAVPLPLSVRIVYDPPLPAERDALAQHMPMGSVIKWYVAYEKPFWRERGLNGMTLSALPPISASFDATPLAGKPGLLVGFIDSSAVLQWMSRSTADRKKLIVDYLVNLLGSEAANPIDYEDQNWPAEEWSRGCYGASMGPGVMTSLGKVIREPHGRIHWAGTETATKWMGYVEGAIRSGERVTAEVLSKL